MDKERRFWIVKPAGSSQGKGIFITCDSADIDEVQDKNMTVSYYISNPLTIDGLKFDLRIYVAITSINPLRIYMHEEGLVRFATEEYQPPKSDQKTELNQFVHLTNYSINKQNLGRFKENLDDGDGKNGSKWSIKSLRNLLQQKKANDTLIFKKIGDLIIKTILAGEQTLYSVFQQSVPYHNNCFQLFGFDVMID